MTTFISFLGNKNNLNSLFYQNNQYNLIGCCGSWFESKFLLHSYLILILVVMILEILAGNL